MLSFVKYELKGVLKYKGRNLDPPLLPSFMRIKDDLRKILEVDHFVEKNILYHLRRCVSQTIKL
jgi:hypothetical protein